MNDKVLVYKESGARVQPGQRVMTQGAELVKVTGFSYPYVVCEIGRQSDVRISPAAIDARWEN